MSEESQRMIAEECDRIKELLLHKNRAYGDSALHPARIFSGAGPVDQILVRIDDKLNRIRSAPAHPGTDPHEDTVLDLIGYLVLLRVAMRVHEDG